MIKSKSFETIVVNFVSLIGIIENKDLLRNKKNMRTTEAVNLLNNIMEDKQLVPDIFVSKDNFLSSDQFNIVLLNFLGEVNNIFFNVLTLKFQLYKKYEKVPYTSIKLFETLNTRKWFELKEKLKRHGINNTKIDDSKIDFILENSANIIQHILDLEVVMRRNNKMKDLDFFKLQK